MSSSTLVVSPDVDANRPFSAPAIMHTDGQISPESLTGLEERLENRGLGTAGAINPRVPFSKLASRFSVDQRLTRGTQGALHALGQLAAEEGDEQPDATATDSGVAVDMSAEELQAESRRQYGGAPHCHHTGGTDDDTHDENTQDGEHARGSSLFQRIADAHQSRIRNVLRRVHETKNMPTIAQERQDHLMHRKSSAAMIQRAVRRMIACARATRLVALVHLMRLEISAPRYPLMVGGTTDSSVATSTTSKKRQTFSPMQYLLELVSEYEYTLYVDNMSQRLVVDSRRIDDDDGEPQPSPRSELALRRGVLCSAEVSSIHETVQERLSDGETMVDVSHVRRGWAGILSASETRLWEERLMHVASTHRMTEDSFMWPLAAQLLHREIENRHIASATPAFSSKSSGATSLASHNINSSNTRDKDTGGWASQWTTAPTSAQVKKELERLNEDQGARLRNETLSSSVERLIATTPQDWFAGGVTAASEARDTLSSMPLPSKKHHVDATDIQTNSDKKQPTWAAAVETDLQRLWAKNNPEEAFEVKRASRLAKRRMLGAECSDEDHSSDDEDDRAAIEEASRDLIPQEEMYQFNTTQLRLLRVRQEEEAWKRSSELVSLSLANSVVSKKQTKAFDPVQWGFDASADSFRSAAHILSAGQHKTASSVPHIAEDERTTVKRMILHFGGGPRSDETNEVGVCVVCEIDQVDVLRCHCGNWVHRECSFDFDEDHPSLSEHVKCCSVCKKDTAV